MNPVESLIENKLFDFESDFVRSLRCIPMIVRFKLDLCGVKLSLKAWSRFDHATRALLVGMPTRSVDEINDYGVAVRGAITDIGHEPVALPVDPNPAWMDIERVPEVVSAKILSMAIAPLSTSRWRALGSLERFALVKLTRGGHENNNFVPALREFGVAP